MSVGMIIADPKDYRIIDYKYYVIKEALREGGMFSDVLYLEDLEEEEVSIREIEEKLLSFLHAYHISCIFAYNAAFDRNELPFLSSFVWRDIMRLAAYKQYNPCIPDNAPCCKTGRLKSGYGVESIMRMLCGRYYEETHNALIDARDELEIMRLLGHAWNEYPKL